MHHEIMSEETGELSRSARFRAKTRSKGTSLLSTVGEAFERRWIPGRAAQSSRKNGKVVYETQIVSPGIIFIEERNSRAGVNTFSGRENRFDGEFTRGRARQAFKDYIALRDVAQDSRGVEHGGEIGFQCDSYEDAARRVLELVGPVEFSPRNYSEVRIIPEYRALKEMGNGVPIKGFGARVPMTPSIDTVSLHVGWYIDADKIKGPHFNVQICPPVSVISDQGQYKKNNPLSLNIAFCFPRKEGEFFNTLLGRVQDALIADLVAKNSLVGYLPF